MHAADCVPERNVTMNAEKPITTCQAGERVQRKRQDFLTTGARESSGCVYLELLSSLAVTQMWRETLGAGGGLH